MKYNLTRSTGFSVKSVSASIIFPRLLLILFPFSSRTCPWNRNDLNGARADCFIITFSINRVYAHPLVWSIPSVKKTAGIKSVYS